VGGESKSPSEGGEARIRLVVALGNPGPAYVDTRHNVGFMIAERFVAAAGETWSTEKRWDCRVARVGDTWVIKPQTFMNLSGRAVSKVAAFYKFASQEICAVYDDVSLPLGRIRLRASGSAGGHNGIKSMIAELASSDFPRLKVGIDGNRPEEDLAEFVLGKFSQAEAETLEKTLQDSVVALRCVLDSGLGVAMNLYNRDPELKAPKAIQKKPDRPDAKAEDSTKTTDAEPRS